MSDFLEKVLHTAAGLVPGLDKVDDCLRTRDQLKEDHRYDYVKKLALPAGAFTGAVSGVYSVLEMGPQPMALFAGPVAGLLVYGLIDGAACALEGKTWFTCAFGDLATFSDNVASSAFGVSPHIATKFIGGVASDTLRSAGLCRN